jgi:hypothetical protein
MKFPSSGELRYSIQEGYGYRLVVDVDPGIHQLSRALIPKSARVARPMYPPHISVVRKQVPTILEAWGKHEGRVVEFEYDNWIFNDETYWWLRVYSKELEEIRVELGLLPHSHWTVGPDGERCFHTTVGNNKV